jgi:hypothetical protein
MSVVASTNFQVMLLTFFDKQIVASLLKTMLAVNIHDIQVLKEGHSKIYSDLVFGSYI